MRIPLLEQLPDADRSLVLEHLVEYEWPRDRRLPSEPVGLWFVLTGELDVTEAGRERRVSEGEHFNVNALVAKPDGSSETSAHTLSACVLAQLSRQVFDQLCVQHPGAAIQLLQVLLVDAAQRRVHAVQAPPSRERDELGRAKTLVSTLSVTVSGKPTLVAEGTPLSELLPSEVGGLKVVAALVEHKATRLSELVIAGTRIEPLTTHEWEGQRIYRQSLALLALEAAADVEPGVQVRMGPSVGFGRRILVPRLRGDALILFGSRLEARMRELAEEDLNLETALWTLERAQRHFDGSYPTAQELLQTWRDAAVPVATYRSLFALEMGPLLPSTKNLEGSYVLCDGDLLLLVYGQRSGRLERPTRLMPARALADVGEPEPRSSKLTTTSFILGQAKNAVGYDVAIEEQAWLETLRIGSVGAFNRACIEGSVPRLIRVAEGFQEKRISLIADEIFRRRSEIDIVCIAGPSSSGKTTFIRRLCVQLQVNGIDPVSLGVDDYYIDREKTPKDEAGDYDFEALEAIRLPLLHDHIQKLIAGNTVRSSRYDFAAGRSYPDGGKELELGPRQVLLIEGIHALNPALTDGIERERVFRIFVCPLLQLPFDHLTRAHASDVRLIRRIVRDRHTRGYDAKETIRRWPKVRAGERRHIYPFQPNADAVFDSSLIYELNVLRVYAERYLLEVPREHPSYATAHRLMNLVDHFVALYPEHVPATSILREFIGGSGFDGG